MRIILFFIVVSILVLFTCCNSSDKEVKTKVTSSVSLNHIWDTLTGTIIATIEKDDQTNVQKLRIWGEYLNGKYIHIYTELPEEYYYNMMDSTTKKAKADTFGILFKKFNLFNVYSNGKLAGKVRIYDTIISSSCDASVCGRIKILSGNKFVGTKLAFFNKSKSKVENNSGFEKVDSSDWKVFRTSFQKIAIRLMKIEQKEQSGTDTVNIDSSKLKFLVRKINMDKDRVPEYIAEGECRMDSENSFHCLFMYHINGDKVDTFYHVATVEDYFMFDLIDAVDIDGDGNKEILFEYTGPAGMDYEIVSYKNGNLIEEFKTYAFGC